MNDTPKERPGIGRMWLVLLALSWTGNGCPGLVHVPKRPPSRPEASVERLIEALPQARLELDTTEIDLGRPLPRGTLVRGWSWNERWPDGGDGNWAIGKQAEIRFPLIVRAPRRLILWMGGPPDAGPPQEAEVRINGRGVARLRLGPELAEHSFSVPGSLLRSGPNSLVFEFGRLARAPDGRKVAAVLEKVLIKPDSDYGRRALRPVQTGRDDLQIVELNAEPGRPKALSQPGDSRLEFGLLPRPGAELRFLRQGETLLSRWVATAWIEACRDGPAGETCRELARLPVLRPEPAGWVEEALALPELAEGPVRLRFAVQGDLSSRGRGWPGCFWGEPQIVSKSPPQGFTLGVQGAAPPGGGPGGSASWRGSGGGAPGRGSGGGALGDVRHVIVYLIDTLRADALIDPELGLPNLQRLLRGGLWAVDAWAPSSWTKASCASLLTSREPSRHGAVGRDSRLRRDVLSLGLWLERHGIAAQGLVANGNVAAEFGFAQGFRGWRHVYAPAPAVHEAALQALQEARTQRSFTYVHVVDPHDPYEPAEPWSHLAEPELYTGPLDGQSPTLERLRQGELTAGETDRRHLAALYRAEARQLDAAFGELLDGLERLGLRQSTAVVLASDHGEAFGEHGTWLHGDNLEPEQAQVLLGVHRPGPGGGRLEARLASLYDVAPTVCELLGVPAPPEIRGRSLLGPPTQGPMLLELDLDGVERVGLVGPDWAYSFSPGVNHEPRLYARLADPGQRRDLAAALPVAAEALEQWAEALRPAEAARSPAEPVRIEELSPETREQLRAMGYLGE